MFMSVVIDSFILFASRSENDSPNKDFCKKYNINLFNKTILDQDKFFDNFWSCFFHPIHPAGG